MAVPEPLTIHAGRPDKLVVSPVNLGDYETILVQAINANAGPRENEDVRGEVYLGKPEARILFNWLGVFLHS